MKPHCLLLSACACLSLVLAAAAEEWKPVEQPNLAEAFEAAPELRFQDLVDGPDACWEGPIWWVPNPDGKTWDFVFVYYPFYPGPHQVFIYDTGTRQLKKSACPELTTVKFGFHLNRFYMLNGKAIISSGYGPQCLFVYDPAVNEFRFGGYPLGESGPQVTRGVEGLVTPNDDGTLLGGFGPMVAKRHQAAFFTIDPITLKGEFLGEVGPENPNYGWEYRGVMMDGDWIYARIGTTPWRLLGMNVKTRQGKIIAETERIIGDRNTIRFIRNHDYAGLYVSITGLKGGPKDEVKAFWLRDGELTPTEVVKPNMQPIPPASIEKLAKPRRSFAGAFSENDPPPKGMQVYQDFVDSSGRVRCWYRFTNEAQAQANGLAVGQWQQIEFTVQFTPQAIRRMITMADGRLLGLSEGYGRPVIFDPRTGDRKPLGNTMSVYSMLAYEQKVYLCGYPGSQVWIYDPAQPWTAGQSLDTPPENLTGGPRADATPATNPANIGQLKEFTDVHMPWAAVTGADGRVYFGGKVVRIGNGGGLGWWDTHEQRLGGLHEPFDQYAIYWMCSSDKGRYIICSTKPVGATDNPDDKPAMGRLFVYDTTTRQITQQIEDPQIGAQPGFITESQPGLVMGYTRGTNNAGLLYGFDPATGKVLWTKSVHAIPDGSFSSTKKGRYHFGKGPDGFVWATMNGVLARINPSTAEVLPVGKMEDAPIAFANGKVYVAGGTKFRQILGLHAGSN
jgi:outer membrane protein assembly factor BamB